MTPEQQMMLEELRMQAQKQQQGGFSMPTGSGGQAQPMMSPNPQQMSPNMVNSTATRPGRENVGQGKAAALAAQMRGAQQDMQGGPAQGKTVRGGRNFQDQYFAPTWSEVAADTLRKGLGGYRAGQAKRGLEEIDVAQAAEDDQQAAFDAEQAADALARDEVAEGVRVGELKDKAKASVLAASVAAAAKTSDRKEDRGHAVADRDIADQNALDVAQLRKEGSQGQGLGVEDTADQRSAAYSTGLMEDFHSSPNADYVPNVLEYGIMTRAPTDVKGYFTDSIVKDAYETRNNWAAQYVLLLSGKTAREDEKREVRENFFPNPGDKPKDVARKRANRASAMKSANSAFLERGGSSGGGSQKDLGDMTKEELEEELRG
jgi:hypothetical protein